MTDTIVPLLSPLLDGISDGLDSARVPVDVNLLPFLEASLGHRPAAIPHPSDIVTSPQLLRGHRFESFLNLDLLFGDGIVKIADQHRDLFKIILLGGRGLPAAPESPADDMRTRTWPRDAGIGCCAMDWLGHKQHSASTLEELMKFYGSTVQRPFFVHYVLYPQHYGKNPLHHPHAIADINEQTGELTTTNDMWGHKQIDAYAWALFSTFRAANRGSIDLVKVNHAIDELNPENKIESIFPLMFKFAFETSAWNTKGFGPWETELEQGRASEIGPLLGAIKEAKKYFDKYGYGIFALSYDKLSKEEFPGVFRDQLDALERNLSAALKLRIPDEPNAIATECDQPKNPNSVLDSALAFCIYPFDLGLTRNQENAVLRTVYQNMLEVGFRRFPWDNYLAQDYIYRDMRDSSRIMARTDVPNFTEAGWIMFDAILGAYWLRRFETSQGAEVSALSYATSHISRYLTALPSNPVEYEWEDHLGNRIPVKVRELATVEAYFKDTRRGGLWMPNHNSQLQMCAAFGALMTQRAVAARELFLKNLANGDYRLAA